MNNCQPNVTDSNLIPAMIQRDSLGDGPVDVWDDDFVVVVPQVNGSFTAAGALILCGHTEHHTVASFTQIQTLLPYTHTHI